MGKSSKFAAFVLPLAVFFASGANAAISIESSVISCSLVERADVTNFGPPDPNVNPQAPKTRYSRWVMSQSGQPERMPMTVYWRPLRDGGPELRVNINGQDRSLAKLLSISEDHVSGVLSLSDSAVTRSWLVTVNFRRETVSAARVESSYGGLRVDAYAYDCNFDQSAEFEPGLLGDRFKYLK